MLRVCFPFVLIAWLAAALHAEPLRVLAMGDSLTEEYVFEFPFSAPDSNPMVANAQNWPEILSQRRGTDLTFGSYSSDLAAYSDLRNGGYAQNYGIPGFTTADWVAVVQAVLPLNPLEEDFALKLLRYRTRLALTNDLQTRNIGVVVLFLGGNDLKSDYSGIFRDDDPPALLRDLVARLGLLHDFVRSVAPSVPIVIATAPDIGATPEVSGKYTDPLLRSRARARIAAANQEIIALAAHQGAAVARIDRLTERIFDEIPFHLNGTVFSSAPDPENGPLHLFCKDGFHPSTSAQALVANELLAAIRQATGISIPLLPNREILGEVLGLDPDRPYLDWAGGAGPMAGNPDGDALPNLAEFVLGTNPHAADSPLIPDRDGTLRFSLSPDTLRFAHLEIEESTDLAAWAPVPASRIVSSPDGPWEVMPSGERRGFYRLSVRPKP